MHDFWDPCWPLHLAPLPAGHEGYTGHALVNDNGNTGSLGPELFTYSQSTHPELFSQTPTYDLHGPVEPMLELPPSHKRIQYGASPDFTCGKTTASQRTSVIAQAAGDTSSDLCSGQWCQPNFLGYAQRVSIADTIAGTPTLVDVKGSTRLQKRAGSRHSRQIRRNPRSAVLICRWKGCRSTDTFGREADLMRHLKAFHVFPRSYHCPVYECDKVFNRKDNRKAHVVRTHKGALESLGDC